MRMTFFTAAILAAAPAAMAAETQFELPPEVTPALRAACEPDVRRLCVRDGSTVDSVRQCVLSKFTRLARRCQFEIASAGLAP